MSFDTFCQDVARRFIQSVMVVDDRAVLAPAVIAPAPLRVVLPTSRTFTAREIPDAGAAQKPDMIGQQMEANGPETEMKAEDEDGSHSLDGMRLTRSFAKLGVACSIYVPEQTEGEEEVSDTVRVARHADVVVLDWKLGTTSDKARQILRRIIEGDTAENGRLRLIAIYTGEPQLPTLLEDVLADLTDAGVGVVASPPSNTPALHKEALRIVFINKARKGNAPHEPGVGEDDLPERLVREFAEMSRGIMPAVALGSITAVRNSSHHVLAKFHRGLDAALATHRVLQTRPQDAEAYATDLIADELTAILESSEVGAAHAGIDIFTEWVGRLADSGHNFPASADANHQLTPASVIELLTFGTEQLTAKMSALVPPLGKTKHADAAASIFNAERAASLATNLEFSRLAALRREAHGRSLLPTDWVPALSLGTVIVSDEPDGALFACIQPVCDSVRVAEPRRFPLVPLARATSTGKFALVIRLADGSDGCFEPDHRPYKIEQVVFAADRTSKTVRAVREGKRYIFLSEGGKRFEWLADLKGFVALRFIQRSAGQVDRIGLDEYEWLRRRSG